MNILVQTELKLSKNHNAPGSNFFTFETFALKKCMYLELFIVKTIPQLKTGMSNWSFVGSSWSLLTALSFYSKLNARTENY
jgi:hypothetical protein